MGGDIAAWSALRGFTVTLQDRAPEYVAAGAEARRGALRQASAATRSRMPPRARALRADVDGAGVADADVIIEAIFESLEAKQALYARFEPRMKPALCSPPTPRASCSSRWRRSSRSPSASSACTSSTPWRRCPSSRSCTRRARLPRRCRSPPASRAASTSCPFRARAPRAFIVNRVLTPYMYEAMLAAEEGVPLASIDRAAVELRHAPRTDRAHRRRRA